MGHLKEPSILQQDPSELATTTPPVEQLDPPERLSDLPKEVLLPEQQQPTLPEGCPLTKLYNKRAAEGRDLTIFVADWNLERGTGKTTLAMRLAAAMDRNHGLTLDKATLSAKQLIDAYTAEPLKSGLLIDEGQADASNRRSMSGINEAMRKIVGMGRVEQKYLVLTAPGVHQVDKDIRNMCDIWIFATELGKGRMFRVGYNPFSDHELTQDWGTITWRKDLPGRLGDVYEELTAEKRRRMRGESDEGDGYVDSDEAAKQAEQAAEQAKKQKRREILSRIYESDPNMTQQKLADAVGLSRSHVANILSGDA